MPDSSTTNIKGLTAEQLAQFHDHGYLAYGPALDDSDIEELRNIGEELYADASKRTLDLSTDEGQYTLFTPVYTHAPRYGEIVHRHPLLLDLMESILGPVFRMVEDQYFYKPPLHGAPLAFHHDNIYYGYKDPKIVTCWIALDDATPENGCLQILPGSHKQDIVHLPIEGSIIKEAQFDHSELVLVTAKAGELVLMDGFTVHGSGPNTTDRPRRVANIVAIVPCEDSPMRPFTDEGNPYLRGSAACA